MKPAKSIRGQDYKEIYDSASVGEQSGICTRIIQNAKPTICFYSHTPEGVFTFLSPSAKKIFGFTPQEGVGKKLAGCAYRSR